MDKGKLYLIPNIIADDTHHTVLSPQIYHILPTVRNFLVEDLRNARRFLSALKIFDSIEALNFQILNKDTGIENLGQLLQPLIAGENLGIISEAGCPGVADPGALAVNYAHKSGIRVIPLVGPSSLLLSLMASGLNGQRFAFHGYLPIDQKECAKAIRHLEQESRQKNQTQIFIETPYRNNQLKQGLLNNLQTQTLLTIAMDITGTNETIKTMSVNDWKGVSWEMPKAPAVFLILAI